VKVTLKLVLDKGHFITGEGMRRKSILSLALVVIMVIASITRITFPVQAKTETKRQIIIFEDDVDSAKKDIILEKHKALKIKEIKGTNAVVVMASVDTELSTDEDIRIVEEDYVISISGSNSKKDKKPDEELPAQPEETIPWGVEYIKNLSPDSVNTGNGLKVAIIDTGIDVDHPDLVANIKGGYNATSKKKSYDDDSGHGTHVAGIIAAVDNEIGVIGVASEADLYAIKALDAYGDGYVSDIVEGIEWCIENDIDIINMSFGMANDSLLLHEAVQNAYFADIVMVAAAGNNYGGSCEYPAAYSEVIGVGAINIDGSIANFSAIHSVDNWAPGSNILSTFTGDTYKTIEGTSMATAFYSGLMILK